MTTSDLKPKGLPTAPLLALPGSVRVEMKVVFLDIDGVLNCETTPNPRNFPYYIDSGLIPLLHKLIATTGAEVVLTSTWRYDPAGVFSARNQGIPFIDTTPDLSGEARSREIIAWLEAHPEVERYIVIDDEDDELDALPLFQPLRSTGITDELVEAAAAFLNGESDKDMRRSKIVRLIQNVGSILRGHVG